MNDEELKNKIKEILKEVFDTDEAAEAMSYLGISSYMYDFTVRVLEEILLWEKENNW